MYAEIEYKGKEYSVEIPRKKYGGIEILGIRKTPTSGVIANALTEMTGHRAVRHYVVAVKDEERNEVILACGWRFSQSRRWKETWEFLYRKAGGRNSGWGKSKVRRIM